MKLFPILCAVCWICLGGQYARAGEQITYDQLSVILNLSSAAARSKELKMLQHRAQQSVRDCEHCAKDWLMLGIICRELALTEGGVTALKFARLSRKALTQALRLDRHAGQGSAMAYLGWLYHETPGWPFSFGDDEKAGKLLTQALAQAPDNALVNLAYAQFCFDKQDFDNARRYLDTALQLHKSSEAPGLLNPKMTTLSTKLNSRTDNEIVADRR